MNLRPRIPAGLAGMLSASFRCVVWESVFTEVVAQFVIATVLHVPQKLDLLAVLGCQAAWHFIALCPIGCMVLSVWAVPGQPSHC
eukprot:scaffold225564_cov17-Tisochrysis_lutea.AAC.2